MNLSNYTLEEYISWHAAKAPDDAVAFFSAFESLQKQHVRYQQLPLIALDSFAKYGIPLGIGLSLLSDMTAFQDEKIVTSSMSVFHSIANEIE